MKTSIQVALEDILKRKQLQRNQAKDVYDRINAEYMTLISALSILDHDSRYGHDYRNSVLDRPTGGT